MFDIAFSELVVIGIVMLVVIGPKRLPEVARTAGRWAGQLRRFVGDVKRDLDVELRKDELAELRKVKEQLTETRQMFEQTAGSTFDSFASIKPPETAPSSGYALPAVPEPDGAVTGGKAVKKKSGKKKPSARKSTTPSRSGHGRAARKRR